MPKTQEKCTGATEKYFDLNECKPMIGRLLIELVRESTEVSQQIVLQINSQVN